MYYKLKFIIKSNIFIYYIYWLFILRNIKINTFKNNHQYKSLIDEVGSLTSDLI